MDFNLLLGNGDGVVMVFIELQSNGNYYTELTLPALRQYSESSLDGLKEGTAHSQGIFENSTNMRKYIESEIRENVTKIAGVYNFKKRFFFNQVLGRDAALNLLLSTSGGISSLINHASTTEMLSTNGGENLIDALLGGTETE